MELQIHECEKEGIRILELRGSLVAGGPEATLRETIFALADKGAVNVILNLAETKTIDDEGLGAILYCSATLRNAGGALKLLSLENVVSEPAILMRLGEEFEVFGDEQDAANSFFPDRTQPQFDVLKFVEQGKKQVTSFGQVASRGQA